MKPDRSLEFVSTTRAAAALGVSVSTVKRWVEKGILPAQKTAGGHRKLLLGDVVELARQGKSPARDLSRLKLNFSKRQSPSEPAMAKALFEALVTSDAATVRSVLHGAYQSGMPIERLADAVVGPAMQKIGSDWECGRIDVMHEHRASQLCTGVLYELKSVLEQRVKRQQMLAVGGALEGDLSVIPSLLAQMVLLDAGWDAVNLGSNTPLASLRRALEELKPRLIWLSASHIQAEPSFVPSYCDLYQAAEEAAVPVVIGGRALTESLRASIPYTSYGAGLSHLAAFARTLHPRPRRPVRGRPTGT